MKIGRGPVTPDDSGDVLRQEVQIFEQRNIARDVIAKLLMAQLIAALEMVECLLPFVDLIECFEKGEMQEGPIGHWIGSALGQGAKCGQMGMVRGVSGEARKVAMCLYVVMAGFDCSIVVALCRSRVALCRGENAEVCLGCASCWVRAAGLEHLFMGAAGKVDFAQLAEQ